MSILQESSQDASLTDGERELIAAIASGQRAQLDGKIIRARVIRDLAIEIRDDWPVQPAGVRIYGAVIDGTLDLEGCTVAKPLLFFGCRFGEDGEDELRLQLRDTRLRRLGFYQCIIHGGLKADRSQVESAVFIQSSIVNGPVRFRGAEIGGALSMEDSTFSSEDTALVLDNAVLGGPWLLRGSQVHGEVRLPGSRIRGGLLAEAASFSHKDIALIADGVQIDGPWVMSRAYISGRLQMRGAEIKGVLLEAAQFEGAEPVILADGARIDGDWSMAGAKIKGGLSFANSRILGRIDADNVQIRAGRHAITGGGLYVRQGWRMNNASLTGNMRIDGAEIGKTFNANDLSIDTKQQAISANVIRIGGDWIMRNARITGSVRFPGADIEGQLALTGSHIKGGVLAIRADGARIRGGWFMGRANIEGRVRFPAAFIGNQVRFRGSRFKVRAGPAIAMNGATIKRDLILNDGFKADGGIAMDQTQIAGTVDFRGSNVRSALIAREGQQLKTWDQDDLVERYDQTALSLVDARFDRLRMPEEAQYRPLGIIDLSRAHIGTYEDYAEAWPPAFAKSTRGDGQRVSDADGRDIDHLILDGFAYEHLEYPSGVAPGSEQSRGHRAWQMRLKWLAGQSESDLDEHFKPQAWVELAKCLSAQGLHEDARQISIARRRWHRRSASASGRSQLQSYLLDLFALFGFNPWRTVAWMVLFVFVFAGIWSGAAQNCAEPGCADETVFVRSEHGRFSTNPAKRDATYPEFNALAYSFDLFIPVISFGYQDYWRPNMRFAPITTLSFPNPVKWAGQTLNIRPPGRSNQNDTITIRLTWGAVLYVLHVFEMIFGLVLTSLAVTGFTGLLRRDE